MHPWFPLFDIHGIITAAEAGENPFASVDGWIVISNILLVVVTIIATGWAILSAFKEGHKHEEHMVDSMEADEERIANIALHVIDAYEHTHTDHDDHPALPPASGVEPPDDKEAGAA